MGILKEAEIRPQPIAPGRTRYLAHTDHLMMVVIDFADGPSEAPDPPHSHPHEQISYVVSGEVLFFWTAFPPGSAPATSTPCRRTYPIQSNC